MMKAIKPFLIFLAGLFSIAGICTIVYGSRVIRKEMACIELRSLAQQGQKLMFKKKLHQAARLFQNINNHFPNSVDAPGYYFRVSEGYHDLAYSLIRKFKYRPAKKFLLEGLQYDPGSINLLKLLGEVYEKQGDRKKALSTLEKLYQLKPDKKLKQKIKELRDYSQRRTDG